ncbi:MAG TPA: isoprenylcysteine carboxylmethyltransferase family protein [Candidatus Cybelea sp.]|nr:isoprenylcysteine carboxylmethyltransferase family protein [Candidatus Cybelea sp.]
MLRIMLPPVWLLIAILAMVALGLWAPGMRIIAHPWTFIGLVPMVVGIAIGLMASAAFHRAKTTIKPFEVSSALVTDGVFGLSRNPIYLGMVLLLIGVALLTGAATPFAVVVLFALIIHYGFIRMEEGMLVERFGTAWEGYAARVRRWV